MYINKLMDNNLTPRLTKSACAVLPAVNSYSVEEERATYTVLQWHNTATVCCMNKALPLGKYSRIFFSVGFIKIWTENRSLVNVRQKYDTLHEDLRADQ
jgi:hypothetical protein